MDYFSELLESYDKLKKRTFKLTYLTEEDDKSGGDDVIQYVAAVKAAFKSALDGADQIGVGEKQNINFESKDASEFGRATVKVSGSNLGEKIYTADEFSRLNWKNKTSKGHAILAAWASASKEGSDDTDVDDAATTRAEQAEQAELDAQLAEQERLKELEEIGGALAHAGRDSEVMKEVLKNLKQSERSLKEFCGTFLKDSLEGSMKNVCARPGAYIAGGSTAGFEYKLSKGRAVKTDEAGNNIGTSDLEPGLLQAVTESHAALTDFLNGQGDCETIQSKIGMRGDRLVLFGASTEEGVTITPNALQNAALEMMQRDPWKGGCGELDFKQIIDDELNGNKVNAVKGTFNELTLQLAVSIVAANTEQERRDAFKEIAAEIEKRREFLKKYAATQSTNPDVALDLGETFTHEVLLQQAGIASDSTALRNWFLDEMSKQLAFVRAVKADGIRAAGKEGGTGDRADTVLLYTSESKAKAAAKLIGSSAQKSKEDEGVWEVGVGQKRVNKIGSTKIGEINSTARMTEIFDETATADANLHKGFLKKIRNMQFKGANTARQTAAEKFYTDLEEKIDSSTSSLTQEVTYIDAATKKIQSIKPETRLRTIADSIKNLLGYDALKNSALGKALFKNSDKYRNFKDPATQQRAQETVEREGRFKAIKDAIDDPENPDNQAAKDTVLRMALICGANTNALSQVITPDDGDSYVVAHNEALSRLCTAHNKVPSELTIKINGTTATMTTSAGISVTFSQQGNWKTKTVDGVKQKGDRETRSQTKLSKDTIIALNRKLKLTKEDTLHKFLQGQMQLLETLLN